VCDRSDVDNHCQSEYYANVYGCAADLLRSDFGTASNHFHQWHYRYVVAGFGQHGYYNLYVYSNGWTVCDYSDVDYYGQSEYYADFYCGCADLFRSGFSTAANDIYQWHYG
jgi:hypothetical protein